MGDSVQLLTPAECILLGNVFETYRGGMRDAKDHTAQDRSIDDPELLVNLASGYDEDEVLLTSIEHKLGLKET